MGRSTLIQFSLYALGCVAGALIAYGIMVGILGWQLHPAYIGIFIGAAWVGLALAGLYLRIRQSINKRGKPSD